MPWPSSYGLLDCSQGCKSDSMFSNVSQILNGLLTPWHHESDSGRLKRPALAYSWVGRRVGRLSTSWRAITVLWLIKARGQPSKSWSRMSPQTRWIPWASTGRSDWPNLLDCRGGWRLERTSCKYIVTTTKELRQHLYVGTKEWPRWGYYHRERGYLNPSEKWSLWHTFGIHEDPQRASTGQKGSWQDRAGLGNQLRITSTISLVNCDMPAIH